MISEEEALAKIVAAISPLGVRQVPLTEALGRFSANNIAAKISLPSFDNSAMPPPP
jgi:molybdopterin biosynthesis enzyme